MNDLIEQLNQARSHTKKLEEQLLASFRSDYTALLDRYSIAAGSSTEAKPAAEGKRPRASITPEVKARVKLLLEAGKTGAQVVEETGISLASVQNIKKGFNLTQSRPEPAPAAPVAAPVFATAAVVTPAAARPAPAVTPRPAPVVAARPVPAPSITPRVSASPLPARPPVAAVPLRRPSPTPTPAAPEGDEA